ncbi:CoA-binding protein [Pontibacterium sp.]|uniref:CoA-binding protein n=1 Tax=Pontibacterium sp. TaxID=2036026 RepID=UPI00351930E4
MSEMEQLSNIDETVIKVLSESKVIALVGASPKSERASHRVMNYLLQRGYEVIPVNPVQKGNAILGQTVVGSLAEIGKPIDMVDVFRNSEAAGAVIDEAIAVGAKAVWLQLDVINEAGAARARKAGLDVVMDRCPKIEIPRLGL